MILLLKITVFGFCLSLLYGWLLEFIFVRIFGLRDDHDNHFAVTTLLGLALLAGLLGIWSFFSKIDTNALRLISAIGLCLLLISAKYGFIRLKATYEQIKSFGLLSWLVFIFLIIYALFLASASKVTTDTGGYHAQSIRWIETYPVVKGIANLHDRLGFNSNLFLLSAFWGFADQGEHAYQVPGLVIFIAFLLFCLYLIEKSRKNFCLSGVVAAGLLIYLLVEKGIIVWFASPTADLSAAFLSWVIFLLAAEKIEKSTLSEFDFQTFAIVTLSFFDITIKLSTTPVVLVSAYIIWRSVRNLNLSKSTGLLASVLLVTLPWIVRNVLITGYVVYPFYQFDIFNVDWKVPHEIAIQAAECVISWGRIPYQNCSLVMSLKFRDWFPIWYQTLPPADHFLVISILVASSLLCIAVCINKQVRDIVKLYGSIYLLLALGCAYWFTQSPSPRFGYSFLVSLLCFLIVPLVIFFVQKTRFSRNGLMLLMQIFLIGYIAYSMTFFPLKSWNHYLDSYKPYPRIKTQSVYVSDIKIFIPLEDGLCWYDKFPCMPRKQPGLGMRGTKIEDGFYIKEK